MMKNSPIANDFILQKQTFNEGAMPSGLPVQRHHRHYQLAAMPALHGTSNSMSEALGTSRDLALTSNALAKTKKFEKYLEADFTVLPTYGHVRDLAARAGSVRSDDDYAMVWEVPDTAQTRVNKIKNVLKGELCFKTPLREALQVVGHENWKGSHIASSVFFCLLQRCINEGNVAAGRELHHLITKNGFQSDDFLGSHLIRMFTIFDSLSEANQIFGLLSKSTVFPWSAIMAAHAKLGQNSLALEFYNQMQLSGVEPDEHIFVTAVKACSDITALTQGMQVHAHIIEKGFECNIFVGNILMSMYMSCGQPADGCIVFNRLPKQDIVSWNAIIAGYVHCKEAEEAIKIFWRMQQEGGMAPEEVTFVCVLQACSMITCLEQGRLIHSCIIESGFVLDTKIDNALIDMYGKCGGLQDAQTVFDKSVSQGIMTWTSLIAGYAEHGHGQRALHIFEKMKKEGIEPDPVTFVCVLKACFHLGFLEQAINIHAHIVLTGLDHEVFIGNALIDMYAKCGSVLDACIAFERVQHPDVVTFNTLITACGQHGCGHEAFQIFEEIYRRGMKPDRVTFLCVLRACSVTLALEQGISAYAIESGLHTDVHVSSALIDMCVKCGRFEDACKTFERLPKRDVVTWNALMGGYAHHGDGKEVIHLFRKMEEEGMKPDKVTFVYILKACSSIAALEHGWQTHSHIIESGFEPDEFVSTTIVDMYINCGTLDSAGIVFDRIPKKTVVTWNTLITGCTQHGQYHLALQKFKDMQEVGLKPDSVTLLCYLSACSHAGLVVHGCGQFKSMRGEYDIEPTLEHYNSMVDMLGQAGHLTETEDLLETNPFGPNIVGWTSLLTSCRMHTNVTIGRRCFDHIVRADCLSAAGYVLMSRIYAQAGMWHDVKNVEEMRRYANGWKKPAKAFIEVDKRVHGFSVGDTRHPQSADIYAKLNNLSIQIKEQEEKQQGELVTLQRSKKDALCGHCEKLAIAFGLLCTPLGKTIRIAKNIRMCADCHSVTKVISRIETREIIVKDAYRIHHFQDGACSCSE